MSSLEDRRKRRQENLAAGLTWDGKPRQRAPKVARKVKGPEVTARAVHAALGRVPREQHPEAIGAIVAAWDACGGCCAITGIPFNEEETGARRRPWAPSVDRIDSKRGYEPGNVRFVCVAVNVALNDWGDEVFMRMCQAAVQRAADSAEEEACGSKASSLP